MLREELIEPSPRFPANYPTNPAGIDAIAERDRRLSLCGEKLAYFTDIILSQFGESIALSSRSRPGAALRCHVGQIVFVGTEPKMGGVAAWRIVAGMTHKEASGDWAIGEFPGDAHVPSRGD